MTQIKSPATIPVLYEDNHLLVVNKPAGMLIQEDRTGDLDLLRVCKQYLKEKYNKPGNVFLGLVHRLDRPVSGTVVFARTSKAAARLSEQIRNHKVEKVYLALVEGKVKREGEWTDYISRHKQHAVIDKERGKKASLFFKRRAYENNLSLVEIRLITGRHHQIRVQFASRGYPVAGDIRYGSQQSFIKRNIALHAKTYTCDHPTKREKMTFTCLPEDWPLTG